MVHFIAHTLIFTNSFGSKGVNEMVYTWAERGKPFGSEAIGINSTLSFVELLFILPEAARVMRLEGEAGASARRWYLKLIDNFLPQFILSYALKATAQNSGLKELA